MGIKEVRKEIIDNAKNQANRIKKEAEKEKKAILDSVNSRVESVEKRLENEAKNSINQYRTMVLAEAKSIVKKQRLNLERDLINEVLEKAAEDLKKISKKQRETHIKKILKKAEFKYSAVYCAKQDMSFLKKEKPKEADILGGVILENKDGDIRLDLSYDVLLNSVKEQNLADISKLLFN